MPLRVVLELLFLVLAGVGIGAALLKYFADSWRSGRPLRKLAGALAVLSFAGLALLLCGAFLPCSPLVGSPVCHGPKSEKRIALTFDDGPNEPYTSEILDILKGEGIHATFFLVGKNVERYPQVVQRMIREGHLVGNHTWDHCPLIFIGEDSVRGEIDRWEKSMGPIGIPSLKLFRAPHGWKSPTVSRVLKERGYRLVGWSRGVWDSDQPGSDILLQRLTRNIQNGEIILLHDGAEDRQGVDRSQTVKVLPLFIEKCRESGFHFVTLAEFLKIS